MSEIRERFDFQAALGTRPEGTLEPERGGGVRGVSIDGKSPLHVKRLVTDWQTTDTDNVLLAATTAPVFLGFV